MVVKDNPPRSLQKTNNSELRIQNILIKENIDMTQQFAYSQAKQTKAMTNEQFEQIVEAILAGKYSWACVLILRFGGYNPLHYIPYRTYNRLLKDNCLQGNSNQSQNDTASAIKSTQRFGDCRVTAIEDLNYVEEVGGKAVKVRGGLGIFRNFWGE
jgi:hypothetical protein